MTDDTTHIRPTGLNRYVTHGLACIVAIFASWHANAFGFVGAFVVNASITWLLPYAIAGGLSKNKPFNGWVYFGLVIASSALVVYASSF